MCCIHGFVPPLHTLYTTSLHGTRFRIRLRMRAYFALIGKKKKIKSERSQLWAPPTMTLNVPGSRTHRWATEWVQIHGPARVLARAWAQNVLEIRPGLFSALSAFNVTQNEQDNDDDSSGSSGSSHSSTWHKGGCGGLHWEKILEVILHK